MDFDLTDVQASWKSRGEALGREVAGAAAAARVVLGAARLGLLDAGGDLLGLAVAVEAMAAESPAAGVAVALHSAAALAVVTGDDRFSPLFHGEAVAAAGLSSDDLPVAQRGRLSGRAPWVAPITDRGVIFVGARSGDERAAFAVALDAPGVTVEPVDTAALVGVVCGHVSFDNVACAPIGATLPVMTRIWILMAAAGLGIGRRALREALATARASQADAGEQTVQGLLADAATELDAAMLMTWKAALTASAGADASPVVLLADASLAKLMATGAAQRAVERATQVVGADSFRRGHIVERLAQDVRALELFAGRTEALRAAAAEELLPRAPTA